MISNKKNIKPSQSSKTRVMVLCPFLLIRVFSLMYSKMMNFLQQSPLYKGFAGILSCHVYLTLVFEHFLHHNYLSFNVIPC